MKKLRIVAYVVVVSVLTLTSFVLVPNVAAESGELPTRFRSTQINLEGVPACALTTVENAVRSQQGVFHPDSARYSGLATSYAAQGNLQRALNASGARYRGLAARFRAAQQRALHASAARYHGQALHHQTVRAVRYQRVMAAEAARYRGLAMDFYGLCEQC